VEKYVSVVAAVAKVIPEPTVQAIGVGLDIGLTAVSQYDSNDPLGSATRIVKAGQDIAKTIQQAKMTQEMLDWQKAYENSFPLTDINSWESAKSKFENVAKFSEPFIESYNIIRSVANEQQKISDQDVKSILSDLRASEPRLAELHSMIEELHIRQRELIKETQRTVENINRLGTEMSSGILAIDALNRSIGSKSIVLDQRALLYLNEMESQAWYRLKKYHYYLAKSYEYRTLNKYTGNLNIKSIYDKVTEIAKSSKHDPVLNKADIQAALVTLYQEQLNLIRDKILTDFNNGAPQPSSAKRNFRLTREDLNILNKTGSLPINLVERGLFPPNREDIRITSLEVQHVRTTAVSSRSELQTEINVLYPAFSKIKKNGEIYFFVYNKDWNENIKWGADYYFSNNTNGKLEPIKPSKDFESLLKSLLPSLDREAVVQIRPSAWADLTIKKVDYEDGFPKNQFINIDSLEFRLEYDFIQSQSQNAIVEVSTSEKWMDAHIKVSQTDLEERKDGRGNFFRTYNKFKQVTLSAPKQYGKWKFVGWTEAGQPVRGSVDTTLNLTLSRDYIVTANYEQLKPVISLPDTVYIGPNANHSDLNILNTGNVEMEWVAESSSSWINFNGTSSSGFLQPTVTPSVLEFNFESNPNNNKKRLGFISLVAPEAQPYRDTVWVVQDIRNINGTNPDQYEDAVIVYPNPTKDQLFIKLSSGIRCTNIDFFDMQGKLIRTIEGSSEAIIEVNTRSLSKGLYIMHIRTNKKVYHKKLMVM
jgi:hypothetical protein